MISTLSIPPGIVGSKHDIKDQKRTVRELNKITSHSSGNATELWLFLQYLTNIFSKNSYLKKDLKDLRWLDLLTEWDTSKETCWNQIPLGCIFILQGKKVSLRTVFEWEIVQHFSFSTWILLCHFNKETVPSITLLNDIAKSMISLKHSKFVSSLCLVISSNIGSLLTYKYKHSYWFFIQNHCCRLL